MRPLIFAAEPMLRRAETGNCRRGNAGLLPGRSL